LFGSESSDYVGFSVRCSTGECEGFPLTVIRSGRLGAEWSLRGAM